MMRIMKKRTAIKQLGGTGSAAAQTLGISRQAVSKWADPLTPRIVRKVRAAIAAKRLPVAMQVSE